MGLSQNGYYAINLQKNPLDENVIPLEYYDDSNESLNDILYTVYIAYEPDIILLNQEEEIFESSKACPFDSGTSPYMEKHLLKITGIGEYHPFQ